MMMRMTPSKFHRQVRRRQTLLTLAQMEMAEVMHAMVMAVLTQASLPQGAL